MRKGRIESPYFVIVCHSNLVLWRKDQIYTRHCSKQTNKLLQLKNKKFEFTHSYFPHRLLNEQRLIFAHELIVDESEYYFPLDH